MNLATLLAERAELSPDFPAFIDGRHGAERQVSFAEFYAQSLSAAAQFRKLGIRPGNRVLLLIPMRRELYLSLAALWHLGATAVFLDPSAGRRVVAECCARAQPDALIGVSRARWLCAWHAPLRRIRIRWYWRMAPERLPATPVTSPAELDSAHPAILTFTSGSTGLPKGAIRSHGLLRAQYEALTRTLGLRAGDCDLATMPVFTLVNLAAGVTTLVPDADLSRPGYVRAAPVLRQIARFRPDRCVASPAFLERLAEAGGDKAALDSLRTIHTGGAPVFPSTLERLGNTFRRAGFYMVYGSTEAEPISHQAWSAVSPADRQQMRAGAGLLAGDIDAVTRLRIIPDNSGRPMEAQTPEQWEEMALPARQTGEIVVAGPQVVSGYLDGAGDSENKVRVGTEIWHRTGDAGYRDDTGRLWLLGRCRARMQLDGKVLYPFPIEVAAVEAFGCARAACLELDGRPVLVLPRQYSGPLPASFEAAGTKISDIRRLPLPLDRRHNAKIDYPALRRRVRR